MQLILLTEAIDKNIRMSDIDVQQPLDDKNVANGRLESQIDTKVESLKAVACSGDLKQSAEPIIAASENGKTDETFAKEEIEDFNQNDPTGFNKCSEDKNISLPLADKNSSVESIVEETNNGDITSGGSVLKKPECQSGAQISVKNIFENGVENVAECISSQTKSTSVINELDNCQVSDVEPMEHEDVLLSETKIKDKEQPKGSRIEEVISVKKNLEKTGEYFESEDENMSERECINKETTQKRVQDENKLIEDTPKGINKILSSQTDINLVNSHVQCMERNPTSEMMAHNIPPLETILNVHNIKDTMSGTITAEENFDQNKFKLMEQKCVSQEQISLIVNRDNESILQENISEALASEKNCDKVLLPEEDAIEQDPSPKADNLIIIKDDNKTILQKNNKYLDNFAVKDNSLKNNLLSEDEPMEQENTSQIDVFDCSTKEAEIMRKETESSEDENGEHFLETNGTELQSTSTTDKTANPETVQTILQENNKLSDNFAVMDNSVENTLLPEDEPMQQETTSQIDGVDNSMKEPEAMNKVTETSEHENGDNISETNETDLQSTSTTEKTASLETIETILQKNNKVFDNFALKDNSVENTLLLEDKSMEQENTSQIDIVDNSMKGPEIMKEQTESSGYDNGENFPETSEIEHKSTLTTDKTDNPETVSENDTNELKITTSDRLDSVVTDDSVEPQEKTQIECCEGVQTFEEIKVAATYDDHCAESKTKPISVLTVKSPTQINESSLTAEIDVENNTNDIDTTESSEIEQFSEKNNDLEISESPVEVQSTKSIATEKGDELALKSNLSEALNEKMEAALKSKVNEDSNDKMVTEAIKIENFINNDKKELCAAQENNIPEEKEDTKVESPEGTKKVADNAFALNYSDEECEIIKSKDKNRSPSKTEEILDTIIACMEVDRGDKKKVIETDKLDISINKTDILQKPEVTTKRLCNLSNTLDILSDDDDDDDDDDDNEPEKKIVKETDVNESIKNSINIDDDDDVMLIDEEPISKDGNAETSMAKTTQENFITSAVEETKEHAGEKCINTEYKEINKFDIPDLPKENEPEAAEGTEIPAKENLDINEILVENSEGIKKVEEKPKSLVPENFLKTFKTNVADMTREDLEDLCLQLIVEGVVDRSNFSEIKTKLKTMSTNMEEWRKKTMILTKQNRDLQIVLKTVQEEQKKRSDGNIVPLKITRSVGMQVYIAENERGIKRKNPNQPQPNNKNTRNAPNSSPRQQQKSNAQIPVPRLVPATTNSPVKNIKPNTPQVQNTIVNSNSAVKTSSPHAVPSGVRNSPSVKPVEKRPFSSVQSVTVDLTDDEPPPKQQVTARNAPQAPVRLVAQNQLLSARTQNQNNGPRKVYIPINSQNQAIRPGQTIMLKSVPPGAGPRPRSMRPMVTIPSNGPVRMPRFTSNHRHPAPLPDVAKQQQPPNWKALPPSPDLKISKVENGIVISWKIEGYQEDSYEQIASYQLYAYQETSTPPSTLLWKKIGDVKALPLPMACTLTQFMAGYKYYFAVRAIDVRSRIGPFSLPGSILLLNK